MENKFNPLGWLGLLGLLGLVGFYDPVWYWAFVLLLLFLLGLIPMKN